MSNNYWQQTVQMFGSMFEKPKMREDLLNKPPFKYLLNIIFATIEATGFAKNLYTEEERAIEYYDNKDKKIIFLDKMIALVSLMNKQQVEVKPSRILAGAEADKTNLFLQAMYKAAVSGKKSGPFVKEVLAKFKSEEVAGGEETKKSSPKEAEPEPKEDIFSNKPQKTGEFTSNLNAEGHGVFVKEALKDIQAEVEKPQEEAPQVSGGIRIKHRPGRGTAVAALKVEKVEPFVPAVPAGEKSKVEVKVIQKLIQSLGQNINPLKKSIDFVNDDIETMNKEMERYRNDFLSSKEKHQQELAATEEQLQPLLNQLAELEGLLKEKEFKIQGSKAQILQNEYKIERLLYTVVK